MGVPAGVAQTAVRFSFDASVSREDLEAASRAVAEAVAGVKALGTRG
jgi:cysteine desulfurase